jgi:hypothetical protein
MEDRKNVLAVAGFGTSHGCAGWETPDDIGRFERLIEVDSRADCRLRAHAGEEV